MPRAFVRSCLEEEGGARRASWAVLLSFGRKRLLVQTGRDDGEVDEEVGEAQPCHARNRARLDDVAAKGVRARGRAVALRNVDARRLLDRSAKEERVGARIASCGRSRRTGGFWRAQALPLSCGGLRVAFAVEARRRAISSTTRPRVSSRGYARGPGPTLLLVNWRESARPSHSCARRAMALLSLPSSPTSSSRKRSATVIGM